MEPTMRRPLAPAAREKAKAAGAKGLRIVGSIETGQELVQRFEVDDVFVGLTGNWLTEELAVATGGLDVFAADMNCTVPTLGATCAAHGTVQFMSAAKTSRPPVATASSSVSQLPVSPTKTSSTSKRWTSSWPVSMAVSYTHLRAHETP